jgi:hypothetical protein
MMPREAWCVAIRAAHQASWRVALSVSVIVSVPVALLAAAAAGLDGGRTALHLLSAAVLMPASMLAHELGHTVTYSLVARRVTAVSEVFGIGRWGGGQIVRWALDREGDAAVALAGPLAGFCCALPLLAPGGSFLLQFPFVALFGVHLLSLRRTADDGTQAWAFWKGHDHARAP